MKKSTEWTQERRQHARGIRIHQARYERGGGCSDETKQQNNRMRHQATQGSEKKTNEGDARNKTKKEGPWNTENDKKSERKNKEKVTNIYQVQRWILKLVFRHTAK